MKETRYFLLEKEGFNPIKLRTDNEGRWEWLAYTNSRLDDRWEIIKMSEEYVWDNIHKYGKELYV